MDDGIRTGNQTEVVSAKHEILALARTHGITYRPTALDVLGNDITRLAGDDVHFDKIQYLLLALRRAGKLSTAEANRLHIAYLRQRSREL